MLKDTCAVVEKGVKAGKSLEQLKQEKVLDAWKLSSPIVITDLFIETLYNDITGRKGGAAIKHN